MFKEIIIITTVLGTLHSLVLSDIFEGHSEGDISLVSESSSNVRVKRHSGIDKKGWTNLHIAAAKGLLSTVKDEVEGGVHPDVETNDHRTPLYEASHFGHDNIASYLIKKNADVNRKTRVEQRSPLHAAAGRGNFGVARLLVDNGADVEAKDNQGRTPLFEAAWSGDTRIIRLLLSKGANVNSRTAKKETALHAAAKNGKLEAIKVLIENGAEVNPRNTDQKTPLYEGRYHENQDVAKVLRQHGAKL